MAQINFANKQINCKIVYYGPGMCGKTTNLLNVHDKLPESKKTEMTSIATEGDRTLFFDFLPLDIGNLNGMDTKFHLYTVPGQVFYDSTRKLVLQGADGVVFVADSQRSKKEENIESIENLKINLEGLDQDINEIPLVIQYNKRDLEDIMDIDEMQEDLNKYNAPYFEAIAYKGDGVYPTLKAISQCVIEFHSQRIMPPSRNKLYSFGSEQKTHKAENTENTTSAPQQNRIEMTAQPQKEEEKIVSDPQPQAQPQHNNKPLEMKTKPNNISEQEEVIEEKKKVEHEAENIEAAKQYRSLVYNSPGGYKNLALKKYDKKPGLLKKFLNLIKR
jgi:signal recognition particle receptor subunit beta